MAVLFISHKYPPSIGGMEKQSFELITGYQKIGKSYAIIYENTSSKLRFFLTLRHRISCKLKECNDIDIIHLNDGLMACVFYLLHIQTMGIKIVVTWHGLDLVYPLGFYQEYILPKLRHFDAFICVSAATASECIKRGFDPHKIHVVHNGVDHILGSNINLIPSDIQLELQNWTHQFQDKKIILAIGRPVRRKGFSWFASQVLPRLQPDVVFVHVGNISTKPKLYHSILPKSMVRYLNLLIGYPDDVTELKYLSKLNHRIVLAGTLPKKVLEHLVRISHLVILPNIKVEGDMEGFGLVALEASMMGKTVIASDIEGIKDAIIDGKNGIKAVSGFPEDWVNKINALLPNVSKYDSQIIQFTKDHFSWKTMVEKYEELFDQIKAS